MSVYRRGDIYHIELRKRGFDRLRISSGTRSKATANEMQEALKWLMDRGRRDLLGLVTEGKLLLADLLASYQRDRSNVDHLLKQPEDDWRLGDLVDDWIAWMKSPAAISNKTRNSYAAHTIHRYGASWAKLFATLAKGRETKLSELNKGSIVDYRVQRVKQGTAVGTLNRDLVALASFLKWCEEERSLPVPVIEVKRQHEPQGRERYLTADELVSMRSACPSDWWPLFATLVFTGMRVDEAQKLRCGDVNLGLRRISIHNGMRTLKTSSSNRDVPIADPLAEILEPLAGSRSNRADFVFAESYRDYGAAYRAWKRICLAAGLHNGGSKPKPNARIHDLRHTFGVHAALAGVPVTSLQTLLGHRTAIVTLRYMKYAAEAQRQQSDVARVVGSMLGGSTVAANANNGVFLLAAHNSAHSQPVTAATLGDRG